MRQPFGEKLLTLMGTDLYTNFFTHFLYLGSPRHFKTISKLNSRCLEKTNTRKFGKFGESLGEHELIL